MVWVLFVLCGKRPLSNSIRLNSDLDVSNVCRVGKYPLGCALYVPSPNAIHLVANLSISHMGMLQRFTQRLNISPFAFLTTSNL